ncbi:ABC transporter substrate-binding protein [Yaniella halotolerans]|uniref:ABC transporter substrate-binding protein n=1 Tax=Yaniella halotolerans TaxID=225453 RepID=UPI0003B774B0|nr:ABC transporter substrate-binding protein [Yaniella halotolerans]
MAETLRQTYFVPPVPVVVAKHLDVFEKIGLNVDSKVTRSSNEQRDDLLNGECDVAITAIDNMLVWNQHVDDFRLVGQIERTTPLGLYARPGLSDFSDLSGLRFAVDAASNGFAIVAKYLLTVGKISDVEFVEIGGVSQRLTALLEERVDATLLGPPFDEMAEQEGLTQLATVNDLARDYPGQGIVVCESRLDEIQPRLHLYLKLLHEAVTWTASVRRQEGLELLAQAGFGPRARESGWDARPATLVPSAAGLELLVHMRDELGMLPSAFQDIHSLWRSDVLEAALGSS